MSALVRGAAIAVFLDFLWCLSALWFGQDSAGRSDRLLALGLAGTLGGLAAVGLKKKACCSRITGFLAILPLLGGWLAGLFLLDAPFEVGGRLASLEGGSLPFGSFSTFLFAGVASLLFLGVLSVLVAERERLPWLLFGMTVGLGIQELWLLPAFGWLVSSIGWMAVLFAATFGLRPGREKDPSRQLASPLPGSSLLFLLGGGAWAISLGGAVAVSRYFLRPHLSSTRFSDVALVFVGLAGLSLGSLLASAFGLRKASGWVKIPLFTLLVPGAGLAPIFFLQRLARLHSGVRFDQGQPIGSALWEGYTVLGVVSVASVLFGATLFLLSRRAVAAIPLGLGLWVGSLFAFDAIPERTRFRMLANWSSAEVFDYRVTEEGLLTHVWSFGEARRPRVQWNREPISRPREWKELEREEILLAARRSLGKRNVLIQGTVLAGHREAIPESGFEISEYLDSVPPFVEGTPRGEETDLWRFLCRTEGGRYDAIVCLSRPFLTHGHGDALSREVFERYQSLLREDGKLFVWIDSRSMTDAHVRMTMKTFFDLYPTGNLWIAQDGYAGPLLCLESKTDAPPDSGENEGISQRTLTGQSLLPSLGAVPVNHLVRPGLEVSLSLNSNRGTLPSPSTLRGLRDLLSPDPEDRQASWYLFEGLALHEADAVVPESRFAGDIDWIQVSVASIKVLSEGLSLHPDSRPLAQVLVESGWRLFERKDYEILLENLPKWIEKRPDDPGFLTLLGSVHIELLDYELALPYLEQAASLDPDSTQVHRALGRSYSALGLWPEAVDAYTILYAMDPEDPQVRRDFGLACFEVGDYEQAEPLLVGASSDFPEHSAVRKALEFLRAEGELESAPGSEPASEAGPGG